MKKNSILLLLSMLISSILLNIYQVNYSDELSDQIAQRDTLIRTERVDHYLHDTIQIHHSTSYSIDGKVVSFEDLFDMLLKLEEEKNLYRDSCNYYKHFFTMSQKFHNDEFKAERHGDSIKYSFKTAPTIDISRIDSTLKSLSLTESLYKSICKKYDIQVTNLQDHNGTLSFEIHADKLDSALMLLPYYGHKLKFDTKKNKWLIK